MNLDQTPHQTTIEDASGASNTIYALAGPSGSVPSTETANTPLPETIYAKVKKPTKPDHQPTNTDNNNDAVHSLYQTVDFKSR